MDMNDQVRALLVAHVRAQVKSALQTMELLINTTPTGKVRNDMTSINLSLSVAETDCNALLKEYGL